MAHDMGGAVAAVMITAMIVMMLVMGGFSLAFLARSVPAAWRARIRHAIRWPTSLAGTSREGTR
jgi:hypothetical protein